MENIFLTKLDIKSVRHLHGIEIPLSDMVRKHLILTGKNGSGKTSTLESLKEHLEFIISDQYVSYEEAKILYNFCKNNVNHTKIRILICLKLSISLSAKK